MNELNQAEEMRSESLKNSGLEGRILYFLTNYANIPVHKVIGEKAALNLQKGITEVANHLLPVHIVEERRHVNTASNLDVNFKDGKLDLNLRVSAEPLSWELRNRDSLFPYSDVMRSFILLGAFINNPQESLLTLTRNALRSQMSILEYVVEQDRRSFHSSFYNPLLHKYNINLAAYNILGPTEFGIDFSRKDWYDEISEHYQDPVNVIINAEKTYFEARYADKSKQFRELLTTSPHLLNIPRSLPNNFFSQDQIDKRAVESAGNRFESMDYLNRFF